jgi:hypothetical protein
MRLVDKIRQLPPVCFFCALGKLLIGRIRFPRLHVGKEVTTGNGRVFTVFRHATRISNHSNRNQRPAVLVVTLRFARFSQAVNRILSLLPIPLIAGFPGFHDKIWMVDKETGDWRGVYEWESEAAVEAYKRSFVLKTMTRRAAKGSVSFQTVPDTHLADYIATRLA